MNKEQFAQQIFLVFEDRSLKIPSVAWIGALYSQSQQFSDEQINKGFHKVMSTSAEDWNKKYGFGGKPAISDWVGFMSGNKKMSPEQEASIEADRIINHAEYYYGNDTLFDNPYTNACVKIFGGLGKIKFKLFDKYNPKPGDRDWTHKRLKSIWLDCYEGEKIDNTPCLGNSAIKSLDYVGNREKCLALTNK